jgi:serine/threonine protein kinase
VLDSVSLTRTGTTVGSAGFMAPEQVMGQAGPAADIFAWAGTISYAASGQPPFGTGATDAIVYRILHAEPSVAEVPEVLRPGGLPAPTVLSPARPPALVEATRPRRQGPGDGLVPGAFTLRPVQYLSRGAGPSRLPDDQPRRLLG